MTSEAEKKRLFVSGRHKARHYAVQAVYQWQLNAGTPSDIEAQFRVDYDMKGVDLAFFREILTAVYQRVEQIDSVYRAYVAERSAEELDPITNAILRLATVELDDCVDVPYKVAINEYVNLAKKFGPSESHKFVNSILDRVARELRAVEVKAAES